MSIDQELRQAATATYKAVGQPDVEAALVAFHATRRRRHRSRVTAAVAIPAVLAAGVLTWSQSPSPTSPPPVAEAPSIDKGDPHSDAGTAKHDGCLDNEQVRCLGSATFLVDGPVKYTVTAPNHSWQLPDVALAPHGIDLFQHERASGVVLIVNPEAARAESVDRSAYGLAHWVAKRPFLQRTSAERAVVDGRPAWVVDVVLRAAIDFSYEDSCNYSTYYCRPLLSQVVEGTRNESGPWRGMVSRYTFVDAPGGTLVIWSWAKERDVAEGLALNADLVRTIDILEGD